MNQPFEVKQPLRIGAGLGPANRFQGRIAEARVYRSALTPQEAAVLSLPVSVSRLAQLPSAQRTPGPTCPGPDSVLTFDSL